MKVFDFVLHVISLTFAVVLVPATLLGSISAAYLHRHLECLWGVAAFLLSCWLTKKLFKHCLDKLEKLC